MQTKTTNFSDVLDQLLELSKNLPETIFSALSSMQKTQTIHYLNDEKTMKELFYVVCNHLKPLAKWIESPELKKAVTTINEFTTIAAKNSREALAPHMQHNNEIDEHLDYFENAFSIMAQAVPESESLPAYIGQLTTTSLEEAIKNATMPQQVLYGQTYINIFEDHQTPPSLSKKELMLNFAEPYCPVAG